MRYLLLGLVAASAVACSKHRPPPPSRAAPSASAPAASASAHAPRSYSALTPAERAHAIPPSIQRAVDAKDRTAADKALDPGRHPAQYLAFFKIKPGMHVAELGAAGGYTSELLARVVGPKGKVYSQNSKLILDKFAQKPWTKRLEKPVNANIVRLDRPFDNPFPPDVQGLDAVLIVLFYHDTVWMKTDRAKMNRAVFKALKRGGIYGIIDHRAAKGHGVKDAKTLHRIEESVVKREVEAAGFKLDAEANFLRNPNDHHDWSAAPKAAGKRRGTSDRFVLRFIKPK